MGHFRKQMITFLVSSRCDLECEYCYVPKMGKLPPEHEAIDLEFAISGMKDFFNQNSSRAIRFFGAGEPTTEFDLMKEIKDEAHKIAGKELKVELQTNGYFSESIGDWIEKNVDVLWISCDGPPEIHDKQRPAKKKKPSSGIVLDNIKRFSKVKRMQTGIRATISPENFIIQKKLIEYFSELGIKFVCAAPSYSSTANPDIEKPPIVEFAKHFVPAFYLAKNKGMFYNTHLIVNFDEKVNVYCRACIPCPHLTTDGFVSCCDWALFGDKYLPGVLQQCVYGVWDKKSKCISYDADRIRVIQKRNTKVLETGFCENCEILPHCAGGCIGKTMVVSGDLYLPSVDWCKATRYLAKHIPLRQGRFPCLHS